MEVLNKINHALQSGYKIICINTTSHYYLLEKLKKIYPAYFEFNYFEGVFHKKSESIVNTKMIDKAIDEYQKNKSDDPLVIINPDLDINSSSFIEMLNKFNYIKNKIKKHIVILIDTKKLEASNKLYNLAYFINADNLSEAEVKNIIGSKFKDLDAQSQQDAFNMSYENLSSLHKKCLVSSGKYNDNFVKYKKALLPKNEFVTELDTSRDIYGLESLKEWAVKRKPLFHETHPIPVRGISIIGIPGTGKSLSSRMVAKELELPLFRFNIHTIMDQYVGNSEKNTVGALEYIAQMAPCVVLVDEIDKMFGHYSQNDSQASKRVLGSILTFMENSTDVFWVFTGNNIENIPPELLRKGRLDEYFYVDLPNRECILEYVRHRLYEFNKFGIDFNGDQMNTIVNYAESRKMLLCDVETVLNDIYLESIETKQVPSNVNLSTIFSRHISSYVRHKDEFDRILEWSKLNAKAAN